MPAKNRQQLGEDLRRVKSKAGFHGKSYSNGLSQCAQNSVHPVWLAQQSPAGAFPVNHRRRATEVQIDGRNWILLQLAGGPDQRGDVVADQLRNNWTPGRIFGN